MAELQQRYNLRSEDLDKPCSYQHTLDIATFVSWKVVGPRLGRIEQRDMDDISLDKYNEQEKRENLLELWVERNGSNATYNAIITVMLEVKKRSEAEKVCKLLTPKGRCNFSSQVTKYETLSLTRLGQLQYWKTYLILMLPILL